MVCKKCGAEIQGGHDLCEQCRALAGSEGDASASPMTKEERERFFAAEEAAAPAYEIPLSIRDEKGEEYTYMYRFMPGFIGAILGVVALFLAGIGIVMALIGNDVSDLGFWINIGCSVGSSFPGLLALLLAFSSIGSWFRAKRVANVKPIATMILGVAGLGVAAIALLASALGLVLAVVTNI